MVALRSVRLMLGPVDDLDLVGHAFLRERHIESASAVSGERPRAAGPADGEVTGTASPPPGLLDMCNRERPEPFAGGREGASNVALVGDRPRRGADPPVPWQPELCLGDRQRRQRLVEHDNACVRSHRFSMAPSVPRYPRRSCVRRYRLRFRPSPGVPARQYHGRASVGPSLDITSAAAHRM